MKRSPKLKPTKWDALVVLAVLLLALGLAARPYFAARSAGELTVSVVLTARPLSAARSAPTKAALTKAAAIRSLSRWQDGAVRVSESDCPNQDCVHSGAISRAGQSIVCLPARVAVTLEGAASDYDLIAG